jgi:quercetin dioxygenase-like cupin family protein
VVKGTSAVLIRHAQEVPGQPMQMEGVSGVTMRLLVGRSDGAANFALRQFTVEPGGHTPRHQHNYEHQVYVLEGSGRVEQDGTFHAIGRGDALYVAPNTLHQFVNDGSAPLTFLCIVPTEFDCGVEGSRATPGS